MQLHRLKAERRDTHESDSPAWIMQICNGSPRRMFPKISDEGRPIRENLIFPPNKKEILFLRQSHWDRKPFIFSS